MVCTHNEVLISFKEWNVISKETSGTKENIAKRDKPVSSESPGSNVFSHLWQLDRKGKVKGPHQNGKNFRTEEKRKEKERKGRKGIV